MLSAAVEGFTHLLDPSVILAAIAGCLFSQIIVAIPGLGGSFATVLVLPYALTLDTVPAIALIIGASVTSGTGNSITSILFGVPGSSTGVAATFDGYPMAQKGEGARALAAGLTASAVGGVIGAVAMIGLFPVVRPVVLSFGPPEFFALVLFSIILIAYIGESTLVKSLLSAGVGMMCGFVGREPTSATLRFSFDQLYLWDGLKLVPFMIGLFAVAEMLHLAAKGTAIATEGLQENARGSRAQGMLDALRYWRATLQSSVMGVLIGLVPGLGGSAAQFMGYAHVARTSKNREHFGKGHPEGVVAAEAANNSTEGASLVPTLAFGIPGGSGAAIVLAALITLGVDPGPNMVTEDLDLIWMIVWVLVATSIIASGVVLLFVNQLVKATTVKAGQLVPVILVVSMFAAYTTSFAVGDLVVALLFGVVGFGMKLLGYSRATLVIGFVLAPMLERNYLLAMQIHGWSFLQRPIVMLLLSLLALTLLLAAVRAIRKLIGKHRTTRSAHDEPRARVRS